MTDNTLDAAIDAAGGAIANGRNIVRPVKVTKAQRTYARALIAKLLEGMEPELTGEETKFGVIQRRGWLDAITEIRRRAGLEVES